MCVCLLHLLSLQFVGIGDNGLIWYDALIHADWARCVFEGGNEGVGGW